MGSRDSNSGQGPTKDCGATTIIIIIIIIVLNKVNADPRPKESSRLCIGLRN
jgi:hypothetical protein